MSDSKSEDNASSTQKPVPKIKDVSMMKAWKDSKVRTQLIIDPS